MPEPDAAERALLNLLREVLDEADPVPPELIEAARQSLTWRTIDAELADLASDTALDGAAVRSVQAPRVLTFTAGTTTLVVEVVAEAEHRRLIGQIVGPRAAVVEALHPAGTLTVDADENGRFHAGPVPAGPLRLSVTSEIGPPLVTSWVTV